MINAVQLEKHLVSAQFVITGEGKSDCQTLHGKAPLGVANVAKATGVPTVLLSGSIDESDRLALLEHFVKVESLVDTNTTLQQAIQEPYHFIRLKTKKDI